MSRALLAAKALTTSTLVVATAGAGAVGVHLYNARHDADDRAGSPAATTRPASSRTTTSPTSRSTSGSSRAATRATTRSTATATTSTTRPVVAAQQPAQTTTSGS